jgi:isoquinoline 1-oxidoreductase beta subunit
VVHVVVDKGKIIVPRVDTAIDCGYCVHPERVRSQIEGAAVMGLSLAKTGAITLKNGAVEQSNFNDYTVMRMSDVPDELHVEFLESDGQPTGVGEIGTPFMMPAIANAFHKLSGKRLYHMPFTPERVLAALKA